MQPRTHELLYIDRQRRGLSQREAARRFALTRDEYARIERGEHAVPGDVSRHVRGVRLRPEERCALRRRRGGITRTELAQSVGCSRYWLGQMELGHVNPQRLLDYWRARR